MSEPNPEVVDALVENHRRFLTFLERRVEYAADAEDILQAAFLKGKGGRGPRAGERRGVVLPLLRNAITDHHRHRGATAGDAPGVARQTAALAH